GNFHRKRAESAGLLYSSATSAVGTSAAGSTSEEAKAMKKTATRWAAIAGGALGAVLLVAPGASADPLPLNVEHSPVVLVPADSGTAQLGDLPSSDVCWYTVFGRWDDELIILANSRRVDPSPESHTTVVVGTQLWSAQCESVVIQLRPRITRSRAPVR